MDYQSLVQYEGQKVRITLINKFWYRAKILSVSEKSIEFIEDKGRKLTVTPDAIIMIEEMDR